MQRFQRAVSPLEEITGPITYLLAPADMETVVTTMKGGERECCRHIPEILMEVTCAEEPACARAQAVEGQQLLFVFTYGKRRRVVPESHDTTKDSCNLRASSLPLLHLCQTAQVLTSSSSKHFLFLT